ncbi:MAG: glycosyltransferase family 4 protein [Ruminococcus sp.]|jgi:1,2-diacylglycerol 3-alpha-glucosyltransferase|nr:glycosyltransferase family 4 protein [Ruminococcus sp.]
MKILITTDWYAPIINGVVTSVLNLEKELVKNGNEVKILTLSRNTHSSVSGNVIYIGSFGAGVIYPQARMKITMKNHFISELIDWHPDIIHSQCEFSTFLFARHIAKALDIPIVHTYHTVYEDYTHYFSPVHKWGRSAVAKFSRWTANACQAVIAPTQKVSEILESYNIKSPISVIPTGINLEKFAQAGYAPNINGISENDFVCVYIGRLAKEKNVDELIKIHATMDNPRIKMLIVGDGPRRNELESLAKDCAASDKVIFTGMVKPSEVAGYYKCGNVFVSASTSETQGLTYIEALASGLPVICRKDKCLDGVVTDCFNGFQYNTPKEYIDMISKLVKNPSYNRSLSQNAYLSSENFSCRTFAINAEKLYTQAIYTYNNKFIPSLTLY